MRRTFVILIGAAAIAAATFLLLPHRKQEPERSNDFAAELQRYDSAIVSTSAVVERDPKDAIAQARNAVLLFDRAALSNHPAHLAAAQVALTSARRSSKHAVLQEVELRLAFRLHDLPRAKQLLQELSPDRSDATFVATRANIAFYEGRYHDALAGYVAAIRERDSWEQLACLAQLKAILGEWSEARQLYRRAQSQLTVRQMRQFAWLEVQQGVLEFDRGRFDEAGVHYRRADRAYSGYWLVRERLAELDAAQGRYDAAIDGYLRALAATPRPDIQQALGDVYALAGDKARAQQRHALALAGYLASVRRGEVQYLHHLVGFHTYVSGNASEAVKWASSDLTLRQTHDAHDALAWALYRNNRIDEALREIDSALATGARDAHVYEHAAEINLVAGRAAEAEQFLKLADSINPQRSSFHVHR